MNSKLELLPPQNFNEIYTPEGRYYVTPNGIFPSVTTVLGVLPKAPELLEWIKNIGEEEAKKIANEAANRGNRLHKVVNKYLLGEDFGMDPIIRAHFLQIKPILDDRLTKIKALEYPIFSKKIRVAGRLDILGVLDNTLMILDIKTSRKLKELNQIENYFSQASAYSFMINEMFSDKFQINKFGVIISNLDENKPSIFFGEMKDHLTRFIRARRMFFNAYKK